MICEVFIFLPITKSIKTAHNLGEQIGELERHHNERFLSYIEKYMPKWKFYKEELNRLPVSHGK